MTPDFAVLRDHLGANAKLVESSARSVTEGVWYVDREYELIPGFDLRNGLYWTHSGSHIVSLAFGTSLHGWGGCDWELLVFKGEPSYEDDICCHDTPEAAESCALEFIRNGHWCSHSREDA